MNATKCTNCGTFFPGDLGNLCEACWTRAIEAEIGIPPSATINPVEGLARFLNEISQTEVHFDNASKKTRDAYRQKAKRILEFLGFPTTNN